MFVTSVVWPKQLEQKRGLPPTATMPPDQDRNEVSLDLVFFPRVRTPCGHGAQVIVEGREEQSDGGERNKDPKTNPNQTPKPAGRNSTIL